MEELENGEAQANQRKRPRFRLELEARAQILHPEKTFTPIDVPVTIVDLNRRGARVSAPALAHREFIELTRNINLCFVKLKVKFPTHRDSARLIGTIAYLEFQEEAPHPGWHLGVVFGEMREKDTLKLNLFLASQKLADDD